MSCTYKYNNEWLTEEELKQVFDSSSPTILNQNKSLADSERFNSEIRSSLASASSSKTEDYLGTRREGIITRYGKLLDRLKSKFGIDWVEDNNQDTLGRFEDGKVYLNLTKMQADTPFHEFAHPFVELIRLNNPILYKSLVSKSKDVYNKQGVSVADFVTQKYPNLSGDDLNSEIVTTAIGLAAINELTEDHNPREKLTNLRTLINTFFSKISNYISSLLKDPTKKILAKDLDSNSTFQDVANVLFTTDNTVDLEGISIDKVLEQRADDTWNTFQTLKRDLKLQAADHKYFFKNKEVKDSVHSKIIEPYLKSIYGETEWNNKYKSFNDMLRDRGTDIHNDFQAIGERYVDSSTGLLRDTPLAKNKVHTNDEIYGIIENYLQDLLKSYEKGTRFSFEQPIYDRYTDVAGTIDFVALKPSGDIEIKDWKSLKTSKGIGETIDDINYVKQTQWKLQIGEYKRMLEAALDTRVTSAMAIPIESNPDYIYDEDSETWTRTKSKTIQIGSLDPTLIPKELAYLAPVVTQDYKTGDPELDRLIEALYKIYENTRKNQRPAEGESRQNWLRKLNTTAETIRDLQVRRDVNSILQKGNDLLHQTRQLVNRKVGDDPVAIKVKLAQVHDLKEEATFIGNIQSYFYQMIEENKLNSVQKEQLLTITGNSIHVLKNLDKVELELGEQLANFKGVQNLGAAELRLGGFGNWFKHLSQFTNRTILTFRKYYDDYRNKRDKNISEALATITSKKDALEAWAKEKGMSLAKAYELLLAKDKDGNINPSRLLYKYHNDFWQQREKAKSKSDIAWFKANYTFDKDKYEEKYKEQLEYETNRATQAIADLGRRKESIKRAMEKFESLNDVRKNERAWMNKDNYNLSIKEGNFSPEWQYLHAKGNEALLAFYNEIVKVNKKASNLGMIGSSSFIPSIRADKMEQLFSNKGEGTLKLFQFLDDIKTREGEGFLERDAITGQEIKRIPVLFTRSLATKLENGTIDYSKYSKDLGRNFAIWAAHVNDYEMKSNLETIGQAMYDIEKGKKVIAKDRYGNPIKKDGHVIYEDNTGGNSDILQKFVDFTVYGKASYSDSDLEFKGLSAIKAGKKLVAWMSHRTLGLNLTSAVTNLFGGTANAFVELTRNGLATKQEWLQSMAEVMGGNAKAKALLTLIDPLMENQTHHRINKLSMSTVNKYFTTDKLYILMQYSDKAVQNPVAIALLKNYMVHEGKLVKIRDFAKQDIKYNIDGLNMSQIRALDKTLAERIDNLKEKESIWSKTTVDDLVKNTDLNDELVAEMREIIRRVNKRILGNMSGEDTNLVRLTALGSFGMQFRNWMPQLISERFKGADIDPDLKMLTEGKVRTTFNHFLNKRILTLTKEAIFGLGDVTLNRMHDRYVTLKQKYIDKGGDEENFVSFSDFKDSYIGNIRSTIQEVAILLSTASLMMAVRAVPPDDKELQGAHKMLLKTLSRMNGELSFFYDPTSFTDIIQKPIPAVGILTDVEQLFTNLAKEGYYTATGNEKGQKKSKPKRYFMRLFPVAKEADLWMAAFNEDYRKDNNIKLIH